MICRCGSDRWKLLGENVPVQGGGFADVYRCRVCRNWIIVMRQLAGV